MKMVFRSERCTGCRLCQLACSAYRKGVFNPRKARLRITAEYRPEGGLLLEAETRDCYRGCTGNATAGAPWCVIWCPHGALEVSTDA